MRVFQINAVPYGSTGKIMFGIHSVLEKSNVSSEMACGYSYHPISELNGKYIKVGNAVDKKLHLLYTKYFGYHGTRSKMATRSLIKKIKKFNPDIIHLHNLHSGFINLPMLFDFIKKEGKKIVWTLHDCWAFTGHCPYYLNAKCEKWKNGCYECPIHNEYPASVVDKSKEMYALKKEWFSGVKNMTIVTPSKWLKSQVEQSFLGGYPVKVINNGINLSVFRPRESEFRAKFSLENKFIVLGVAYEWGKRKGLDVFIELSKRLGSDYKIVLVGVSKDEQKILPESILSLCKTQNAIELAKIYSTADLFVIPTREDNFPTVNVESLACGTPVITFETGGSPEVANDTCGITVPLDDVDELEKAIIKVKEEKPFSEKDCVCRASTYDEQIKFLEYLDLYKQLNQE